MRDDIATRAREMRDKYGLSADRIAAALGITRHVARCACDPDYRGEESQKARRRRKRQNRRNESARRRERIGLTRTQLEFTRVEGRIDPDVVAARLAEIPDDVRTPVQKMLGDPIPCRSALATPKKSKKAVSLGAIHTIRPHENIGVSARYTRDSERGMARV